MDAAAKSLVVYGVYLLLNAVTLVLAPNTVLTLFGLPATSEPWIRVVGLVAGEIGFYFVVAARRGLGAIYPATVHARGAAALVFVALVVAKVGPWQLLLFGAVDVIAAAWTQLAIKRRGNA
jgi:hypothetical protein